MSQENLLSALHGIKADIGTGPLSGYPVLSLAYIGDAVFELCVRSKLFESGEHAHKLHNKAKGIVCAASQSHMYRNLYGRLTEEEQAVIKRGRNAKSYAKAKNASVSEYAHATGLETLFGYLFLAGDISRLLELFEICMEETV